MKITIFRAICVLVLFGFSYFASFRAVGQDDISPINPSLLSVDLDNNQLIKLLQENIKNEPSNTRHRLMLGSIWESLLQYDSAAIVYKMAIEIDSTCIKCKQQLAGVLASKGMVTQSVKLYQKALKLDSTNTLVRSQYARLLKRDSQFREAYKQFQLLLLNDSTNYFIWEQIGDCAMRIDSGSIGQLAYLYSFELNPANMPLAIKLINGFIQGSVHPRWIMPYVEIAYEQDSTYIPLLRVKGYLHFLNEDYKTSEKWLTKAYERGDSTRFTLKFLGLSKFNTGYFYASATLLEKAFALDTTDKVLNFVLAKSWNEIGERQKAIEILNMTEQLITPDPRELAMLYATRGDSHKRSRDYSLAIKQFQTALKLSPDQLEYLFEIGSCYYSANDLKLALDVLNKFLELAEKENPIKGSTSRNISIAKFLIQRINKELFFMDET